LSCKCVTEHVLDCSVLHR